MIRIAVLTCLVALSACGSGGPNPIAAELLKEVRGLGRGDAPAGPPRRAVTRADITAADVAAIRARLESDPAPSIFYAASANNGYVTYISSFRQSLTLRGAAQITATRGLGTDLLSARSSGADPLAQAIPPQRWPSRVQRTYEFPADAPQGRIETYECTFELGEVQEMTILEERYRGVQVSEYCSGPAGSFENLHFADLQSGFVWRSLQWIGAEMELVDLEILLPYTGN